MVLRAYCIIVYIGIHSEQLACMYRLIRVYTLHTESKYVSYLSLIIMPTLNVEIIHML